MGEILLQRREANRGKGRVVPQDADDIRRLIVLLVQRRQFGVDRFVLGCPALAVLGLENVKLGVVDDLCSNRCRAQDQAQSQECGGAA